MKYVSKILPLLIVSIMSLYSTSCTPNNNGKSKQESQQDKFVKEKSTVGAYKNNEAVMVYDEDRYQLVKSASGQYNRIQNDNVSVFLMITIEGANLAINSQCNVKFKKKGLDFDASASSMKIVKVEGKKYWLYNADENLGVIVIIDK